MFVKLPMVEKINATFGEIVCGLLTEDSDPAVHNFNRSAPPEILDSSFNEVMGALGAEQIALPPVYKSDTYDRLINLAVGQGFVKDDRNPNPAGMGLVTSRRRLALATPWSDAPGWVAIYVDPNNPDVTVIASGTGIWNMLPYNAPYQTVALMQSEVERLGGVFDIQNLWVTTSPGALATGDWPFRLDENGKGIVLSGASAAHPGVITKIGNSTEERPYALDLSGLVRELWLDLGIDEEKFFFDDRPNREVSRASKRAADAEGKTTWSSELIAISLL